MKTNCRVLTHAVGLACLLFAGIGYAQGDCAMPQAPSVPDGRTATEAELVATVGEIKAFQEALINYRDCLQAEEEILGEDMTAEQQRELVTNFNDSVDSEEAVAAEFNEAVAAFKAASQ